MKSNIIRVLVIMIALVISIKFSYSENQISLFKKNYIRPSKIPYPNYNPFSKEKEILGKLLFFDTRLSRSKIMSCATCHNPSFMWSDGLEKAIGDFHKELPRKTPTLFNVAWSSPFFWDGRSPSLEHQALDPVKSKAEMGLPLSMMLDDIKDVKGYSDYFKSAFPDSHPAITQKNIAMAIATFERGLVSGQTPFDRWINGNENAISNNAKKGFFLFNTKAMCSNCHSGWNFTDNNFHNIGVKTNDMGRFTITQTKEMKHAFKTPGLREIDKRSPYMHNGSVQTLSDVIDHYNSGFVHHHNKASELKPLHLTPQEKDYLLDFLKTLSSDNNHYVTFPILPR